MKENHGELPCQYCGKLFLIPSKLNHHEKQIHLSKTDKKPSKTYDCQFCDEFFVSQPLLNYHLRFHDAAEKFPCDICGKSFFLLGSLKLHQTSNHAVGLSCEVCKEPMKDKKHLKEHMKTHGDFKCEICGRSYLGPSKLKVRILKIFIWGSVRKLSHDTNFLIYFFLNI